MKGGAGDGVDDVVVDGVDDVDDDVDVDVDKNIADKKKLLELLKKQSYKKDEEIEREIEIQNDKKKDQGILDKSLENAENEQNEKALEQQAQAQADLTKAERLVEEAALSAISEGTIVTGILEGEDRGDLKVIKEARDKKRLPLEKAKEVIINAKRLQGNIICRMEVPEIKKDSQLGGGEVEDVINQIKRFIEYKLITDIKYSEVGKGEGGVQQQTGGVFPVTPELFAKVTTTKNLREDDKKKKKKKKNKKKIKLVD